jgi:hypothetical protein
MRVLLSVGIAIAIAAIVVKLALAPFYGSYSAAECHAAYARANTHADTARLDLHPYAVPDDRARHVCGEVRAPAVESPADISALQQPNEEL